MSMQKAFQKSENKAVAYGVAFFLATHLGALYLMGIV
jgi:hypothetical protein